MTAVGGAGLCRRWKIIARKSAFCSARARASKWEDNLEPAVANWRIRQYGLNRLVESYFRPVKQRVRLIIVPPASVARNSASVARRWMDGTANQTTIEGMDAR